MFSSNALYLANKSILMSATVDGTSWRNATIAQTTPPHCALHALNYVWRPRLPYTIRRNGFYFQYPLYLQQARQRGTAVETLPDINHEPRRGEVMFLHFPNQLETYYEFVKRMVPHEQRIYYLQKAFYGWQMQSSPGLKKLEAAEARAVAALAEQALANQF